MAHGVTTPTIVIHQALHGYADGHRLLASSISLKPRDAKVISTLSDASGSSAIIAEDGYVTGYPLPDAGLYAVAKTWPAPEMPRPGCVWTHTLLVDFADLAMIQDLASLAHAFVRPVEGIPPTSEYGLHLSLPHGDFVHRADSADLANLQLMRRLLWALYSRPSERVFSTDGDLVEREALTLALWSQQWPRLRRSFRFCTLVSSDRSSDASSFDLQFGSKDERTFRGRTSKLPDADPETSEGMSSWLDAALRDLLHAGSLRGFLRALGAELDGGRDLFEPLCELHEILAASRVDAHSLRRAITLIDGPLQSAEARETRTRLVRRMTEIDEDLDKVLVNFTMRTLHLLSDNEFELIARLVGAALWRQDPNELVKMLAADGRAHTVAKQALACLPAKTILADLCRLPELVPPVLNERPDLLSDPVLWGTEVLEQAARETLLEAGALTGSVLDAMIEGGATSLVRPVCEAAGRENILAALVARLEGRGSDQPSSAESRWLSEAATSNTVAMILSRSEARLLTTLVALAHRLAPDDVPNDYGEDPVFTAMRQASGEASLTSLLYLRSWILARALGYRSRNQAELITLSFESVYLAALGSRLPDEAWHLLQEHLPNSAFWGDWDRGRRLRAGIINAFVDRDLDSGRFGQLLPSSEDLFAELAWEAASKWGGRGYLRKVKRALRHADPDRFATRISTLSGVV